MNSQREHKNVKRMEGLMHINDEDLKPKNLWFWFVGLAAFLWLLVRSGTNPKRVAYPCQQAAMPIAASWVLSLLGFLGGMVFLRRFAQSSGVVVALGGILWLMTSSPEPTNARIVSTLSLPVWQVPNPVSKVFVMDSVPPTIGSLAAGDSTVPDAYLRDPAIDTMLAMMETQGTYLHSTPSRPNGVVHSNDVVVIKGNFQWNSRNTTSTDRIKGLIRQILAHPEGFTGEILVCDNTQEIGTGINDSDNNSEDPNQSIIDVVNTFRSKHFPVYSLDWNTFWGTVAAEYSQGDYNNGYVYEASTKISYPKFRSPSHRFYISLRYGIWDSLGGVYDSSRLCIIDFPVLKAHSIAGATIAIKNWIGVLTTAYASERYGGRTAMHNTYFMGYYALVARVMAATFPRLTILDAAWTTTDGPVNLTWVQNTKMLLASTDPVAPSWYGAKFILTPIARYPNNTNPDRPGSSYKNSLDNWTRYLADSAGLPCTKDSTEISVYDRSVLTPVRETVGNDIPGSVRLYQNYPNPFNLKTSFKFRVPSFELVTLKVYDLIGREVTILVNEVMEPGTYEVQWDASLVHGGNAASGIYFYQLTAGSSVETKKCLLLK